MPPLPKPSADALQHSLRLSARIRDEIAAAGGWIDFARYMELALYAPGLGYYSAGAMKFGQDGDFVTAPEISTLFGHTLARQLAQVLTGGGDVLELGAGSGRLAVDLLSELERLDALPPRYFILEVSPDLRQRQHALLRERAPRLAERVSWLESLPQRFKGAIVGNEVLDALPVHLAVWREDGLYQRGVEVHGENFAWRERPLTSGAAWEMAHRLDLAPGYLSEIAPAVPALVRSLASSLEQGVLLLIDYGFGAAEYYHPQRRLGTLMCHYRHHSHDDPFFLPGLQDITAHVDFSAAAAAGTEAGLDLLGYTSQAHFLLNCGLTDLLGQVGAEDAAAYLPLANQAQALLSPAEMGDLFKAIAFGRGLGEPLRGFSRGDKSAAL
ncbi:MAG: SAM-dependent methyltransferase [Sulfuricellaceae bacterium]|nr:SAM-dependent methyltransferase [Sulfuricellaceae bacterium]